MRTISLGGFYPLLFLLLFTGCRATLKEQQRQQWESNLSQQVINLQEKLSDLNSRLANLRQQQVAVENRLALMENSFQQGEKNRREELASIRDEIKAIQATIDAKIKIILDEVARENELLLQKITQTRGSAFIQGYEHVVKSGETLSLIAQQYNSTIKAIIEANQLSDPNSLRVGQKLFIPQ